MSTCWWQIRFGVTLDRRLTFDNHASAVARSCNYHACAIRHIRHLLTLGMQPDSLENRLLKLETVLYGAPPVTIQKLQRT